MCVHPVAMVPVEESDTTSAAYSASLLMKSLQWKVSSYGGPQRACAAPGPLQTAFLKVSCDSQV